MRADALRVSIAALLAAVTAASPGNTSEVAAGARPQIVLGSHSLHAGLRALPVLPRERVRLRIGGASPQPEDGRTPGVTLLVASPPRGRTLAWRSDEGVITHERAGSGADGIFTAPAAPGTYRLRLVDGAGADAHIVFEIAVLVLTPFGEKRGEMLSGYRIGHYPQDLGLASPPDRPSTGAVRGFVALTRETQDLRVSDHFRLGDFACKQQPEHFPKYLVLDLRLLDKLERLLDRLDASRHHPTRLVVMSGYRTPEYNRAIGNESVWSRHTLGDAADVFIDDDADGMMDDLDHDGRTTRADAEVLMRYVEDLDRDSRLVGGAATYPQTDAHGPFVHLDVRGYRARW